MAVIRATAEHNSYSIIAFWAYSGAIDTHEERVTCAAMSRPQAPIEENGEPGDKRMA